MSITPFSGVTDKSPLSPAWFNAKFGEVYSNLSLVDGGQSTSGNTVTYPATVQVVSASIDSGGFGVNVLAYGADNTGVTSSKAAFVSAISAANGRRQQVFVPAGTYLIDSTISLGPSIQGIKIVGAGRYASLLTSTVNGDMFTLNVDTGFGFQSIQLNTGGSPASGNSRAIGVHIIGNTNEFTMRDCEIYSIASFGILLEADTASGMIISDTVFYAQASSVTTMSSGQSNVAAIGQRGLDTAARPKMISNCIGLGGCDLWNLDAANDIFASNCFFRNAVVTNASGTALNVAYNGVRLSTLGFPTYMRGNNATFMNGIHPGNIIIDTGALAANVITSTVSGIADNSGSTSMIYGGGYNSGLGFGLQASYLSIGNLTAAGTAIRGISSTSSLIGAFVVQGSASSFTIITWAAARANDLILVTPTSLNAAVSSLSSGIVAHSHCTQNGQVELRLSNCSTLAQNVSSKTWFLTRITPF